MAGKIVIVAFALFVGCLAAPTLEQNEGMSIFFQHVDPAARIVGGTEAPAGSHPHMVALTNGLLVRSFVCGGSLISQRSVLTAAHCITFVYSGGSLSNNLRVLVGTNRWNAGGQAYSVSRHVTHPHYVSATLKNDIGLLITTSNVANGTLSASLLELHLPTIDGQQCVDAVAQAAIDFNTRAPPVEPHIEICIFHAPGSGICTGDSGSALARVSDGRQIGIVSWGFPCARGAPDMFVRISGYTDWLSRSIE